MQIILDSLQEAHELARALGYVRTVALLAPPAHAETAQAPQPDIEAPEEQDAKPRRGRRTKAQIEADEAVKREGEAQSEDSPFAETEQEPAFPGATAELPKAAQGQESIEQFIAHKKLDFADVTGAEFLNKCRAFAESHSLAAYTASVDAMGASVADVPKFSAEQRAELLARFAWREK